MNMNNTADAVALGGLTDTSIGLSVGTEKNWSASENSITGSVTGVYENGCQLFRKRMECAIMVAIARIIKGQK